MGNTGNGNDKRIKMEEVARMTYLEMGPRQWDWGAWECKVSIRSQVRLC